MVASDTLNEVVTFTHHYRIDNNRWPTAMNFAKSGPLDAEHAKTVLEELTDDGLLEKETQERKGQEVEVYKFNGA